LGQPVRQASALACEGSVCHPKDKDKDRASVCWRAIKINWFILRQ